MSPNVFSSQNELGSNRVPGTPVVSPTFFSVLLLSHISQQGARAPELQPAPAWD